VFTTIAQSHDKSVAAETAAGDVYAVYKRTLSGASSHSQRHTDDDQCRPSLPLILSAFVVCNVRIAYRQQEIR